MAHEEGLTALSITDHDTVSAYETALPVAKELGIEMISGVEFSCIHGPESVHLLGYGFALDDAPLKAFCQRHYERRVTRNRLILEKLAEGGLPVEESELSQVARTPGRPHIAMAMQARGYVKSVDEAFKRYLGDKGPFFVPGKSFTVSETIEIIHEAGGFAVIAHPHFIKRRSVLRELFRLPIDGLEAFYARLPKNQEDPWARKAKELGWFYTGGSDFHGSAKPHIKLGSSWTQEETYKVLRDRYVKNNP